jgi:enoyl-CoA hydratase
MTDIVLLEVSERIATVTLNRPDARNALSSALLRDLTRVMHEATDRDDVDVIILTGSDPAFSAGLDLKELGDNAGNLGGASPDAKPITGGQHNPFFFVDKPIIAAVNGACITGAFELALNCDFIIASENAKFGDTHSRVGVMPGWGLTVLLPQAIGVRRAREMSFTGNFVSGQEAFELGLANHVVPHDELLPTARGLARDIIGKDIELTDLLEPALFESHKQIVNALFEVYYDLGTEYCQK